ncbi:hypothetical protein AgCh_009142 [Apium graveolens]
MAKAQTLKAEFESLTMKDTEQLDDFWMKLNGLVTNIRALREKIEERYVVKKILRAVPTKSLQIASAIEQFDNLDVISVEEIIGSLKAHEERLQGKNEAGGEQQLLLTEEKWARKEKSDGQLLLTREECAYGHFAAKYGKPRREREQKSEVNLVQTNDDEPILLLAKCEDHEGEKIMLTEENVTPKLSHVTVEKNGSSNVWYLDNEASNHMTGQREKFQNLDESVTGTVKFEDGSMVKIQGKGTVSFMPNNDEEHVLKELLSLSDRPSALKF